MNSRKRMLRWASGIMLVLGIGHLSLLALVASEDIAGWVGRGIWAAVPLELTGGGTVQTLASLQNKLAFWAAREASPCP